MKKIVGYTLKQIDQQQIDLSVGYRILDVQTIQGDPKVFVLVDADELNVKMVKIRCLKTSFPVPDDVVNWNYIGTYQVESFGWVFHIFEEVENNGSKQERNEKVGAADQGQASTKAYSEAKTPASVGSKV